MRWYAIHTKPHQELLASSNLSAVGVETFFPSLKQRKRIQGVDTTATLPLFPGYTFAKFDLIKHFRTVTYARGVRSIVTFGSVPAAVEEELILSIKNRLEDGNLVIPAHALTKGQLVRIHDGPMKGIEAVFEREMSGQQRAMLLLKTLDYQARAVVPCAYLEECVGL